MPEFFNADQIIGKTLFAKKDLPVWKIAPRPSQDINGVIWKNVTIKKGESAGVVYSFIGGGTSGPLFWMFKTPDTQATALGKYYYIEHKEGAFDIKALREQGVLTTKELQEQKDESDKSTGDKILDAVKKGGKYILIAASIYYAIKMYKEFKK